MSDASSLPEQIVESIAIGNAKSIGEQPAILANLALANQVFNTNLQQLIMLNHMQAMNQLTLAVLARCVSLISTNHAGSVDSSKELTAALETLNKFTEAAKKTMQDNTTASTPGSAGSAP